MAVGDDQTTIASGATTIQNNTELGAHDEDWDDDLFEDKDIISIEFDNRIEPRTERQLGQLVAYTAESL